MTAKRLRITIPEQTSIREKIYEKVKYDVLNGFIEPGERIFESRIAQEIKTSRTPVREALHMLEREGLLESIPRVGYRVKKMEPDEIEEICEIRIANETLAAQWAVDSISEEDLQTLEDNLIKTENEACEGNPKSFVAFDAEFHEIIARVSGSKRLFELCQVLCRHMLRYRIESLNDRNTALHALEGHREILNSIRNRDKDAVANAIRRHLEWVKDDIREKVFDSKENIKASSGYTNE